MRLSCVTKNVMECDTHFIHQDTVHKSDRALNGMFLQQHQCIHLKLSSILQN